MFLLCCLSRWHQVPFFESLVWINLGLNLNLQGHWRIFYTYIYIYIYCTLQPSSGDFCHSWGHLGNFKLNPLFNPWGLDCFDSTVHVSHIKPLDKQRRTRIYIYKNIIYIFILWWRWLCVAGIQLERVRIYLSAVAGTLFVKYCDGRRTHSGSWQIYLSDQQVSPLCLRDQWIIPLH